MTFRLLKSSLLASIFCATIAHASLPDNYQTLTSSEKQTLLWQNITQSHQKNNLPTLEQNSFSVILTKLKGLFNLKPTFSDSSDEVLNKRVKLSHVNGVTAKTVLIPSAGHPFTGIYKTGAIGILRLSMTTTPAKDSFTPSMAIKFLIPNQKSLNLQVMHDLDGQGGNWNFFARDLNSKLAKPKSFALKTILAIFHWTKSPANKLNVSHLALRDAQGNKVTSAQAPTKITFKPSERVAHLISEDSREDFRSSLEQISLGALYELYGTLEGIEYHIGTIMLESQLLASYYGDKKLFFQHQR